jgi:ATP-binding cassette, subfamily B, bacterial
MSLLVYFNNLCNYYIMITDKIAVDKIILNPINKKITLKALFLKYKLYLIGLILLSFAANAINLTVPRLIGQAVDKAITSNNQVDFNFIYITFGLIIGGFVLSIAEFTFGVLFSERFAKQLRIDSFTNLIKQPYQYVLNQGSSNLITVFSSDIDNIQENFTTVLTYVFQSIALFIGAITLMFLTSWKLSIVALLSLPVIIGGFMFSINKVGRYFGLSQQNLTLLNTAISENINASNLVRVLASFNWEEKKFSNYNSQSKDISISIVSIFSALLPFITMVTNVVTVIFLYLGARQVADGELSVGQLSSFLGYYALLITPIFILGFTSQGISQALTSWKRIEPILNADGQAVEGEYSPDKIKGDIEVKDLTLEYEGKKVLDNINFKILSGQKTAILGPTAAGKSQLLNVILGLTKPTSGQVIIDGVDINNWNKDVLLNKVGICFQESLVFNTNIQDNITLERDISQEDIDIALKTVTLDQLVTDLPQGLATKINERGANLSGGQKQRLTLARAIVSRPDLLLLDDFTARVDADTEKLIRDAIDSNYHNTQIIQVCQKIESIKDYENIIVLMEGQLVGQGTHQKLLDTSSEYKQIYQSQQTI